MKNRCFISCFWVQWQRSINVVSSFFATKLLSWLLALDFLYFFVVESVWFWLLSAWQVGWNSFHWAFSASLLFLQKLLSFLLRWHSIWRTRDCTSYRWRRSYLLCLIYSSALRHPREIVRHWLWLCVSRRRVTISWTCFWRKPWGCVSVWRSCGAGIVGGLSVPNLLTFLFAVTPSAWRIWVALRVTLRIGREWALRGFPWRPSDAVDGNRWDDRLGLYTVTSKWNIHIWESKPFSFYLWRTF